MHANNSITRYYYYEIVCTMIAMLHYYYHQYEAETFNIYSKFESDQSVEPILSIQA